MAVAANSVTGFRVGSIGLRASFGNKLFFVHS